MKRSEAFPSKYLSKEDVPEPMVVTVKGVELETLNSGNGDDEKETKPVMSFAEAVKPMILNNANWATLEAMYGDDSDSWIGKPVTVYVDPSVMFGKKRVGGLRIQFTPAATPKAGTNGGNAKPPFKQPTPEPTGEMPSAPQPTLTVAKGFDMNEFRANVAKQFPYYTDKKGQPNPIHILRALVKIGITALGPDNADEALAMLGYHAQAEEESKQAA